MSDEEAKQKEREAFEAYEKRDLVALLMRVKDELRAARAATSGQFEDGVSRGKYLAKREHAEALLRAGWRGAADFVMNLGKGVDACDTSSEQHRSR